MLPIEPRSESDVEQLIKIEGPKYGCILMRNNSGALPDSSGRPVRFGLGNDSAKRNDAIKSSDEIGFTVVTVTPGMVGRRLAVFTAIECKAPDWKPSHSDKRERAQRAFTDWITTNGGIAGICNSVESFRKLMEGFLR